MARLNYETAETLVFDPVPAHRHATRGVLFTLGFRNIETCGSVKAFGDAVKYSPPDLALAELKGNEDVLCEMIQSIRQGTEGHTNPFLVIIATAWEKSRDLVGQVLNSGADDLLLRPFSTTILSQRIDTHVERRKHFVITHDYVGPDRRSDPSRANSASLFQPPNSLKMKAKDGLSVNQVQNLLHQELRGAREVLHAEKLRRDAFQICVLWRLLQEPNDPEAPAKLEKLKQLTLGVAKRCRVTEFEVATQWCESVLAAVEGLHFGVDHNASMHLLGHAALSLNQVLFPERSKIDHLKAMEDTVAMIHAREVGKADPAEPLKNTGSD